MPDERPGRRAFQIYIYAVCLVTVVVVLFSAASAAYSIIRIAAPGTTAQGGEGFSFSFGFVDEGSAHGGDPGSIEDAERDRGIASLAENGIFALLAAGIFFWHWDQGVKLRAEIASEQRGSSAPRRRAKRSPPSVS